MANLANIAMLAELDGAIPVDKPAGISVHDALKAIKTHFNLVKVGHGGTIDVAASGVFVLLLGNATRFSNELMCGDKTYELDVTLGKSTDTGDRFGNETAQGDGTGVTREALDAALKEWRGDIYLGPSEYSAIMIPGKQGYEIVRTAEGEELKEKLVHVYKYEILEFAPPKVRLRVVAAKGVSIRSLTSAIGRQIGCGAVIDECRVVMNAKFQAEEATPFMKLMGMHPADFAEKAIPLSGIIRK